MLREIKGIKAIFGKDYALCAMRLELSQTAQIGLILGDLYEHLCWLNGFPDNVYCRRAALL